MVVDHVNAVRFGWQVTWMFELGRLAMPLFALAFGFVLGARTREEAGAIARRLLAVGIVAQPAYYLAFGYALPLNILFAFAAAAAFVAMRSRTLGLALVVVAPLFVEFAHGGVFLALGAAALRRHEAGESVVLLLLGGVFVCLWNQSLTALAAAPIFAMLLAWRSGDVPRVPRLFLVFYPLHLAALGLMRVAGV